MASANPLRILQVTAPARFGGLETMVLALVTGLRERGHRVRVLAATEGQHSHPFVTALREAGVPVALPPRGYLGEARYIRGHAREHGVQIVHSHGHRSDVLTGLPGPDRGYRIASTVHGFTGGGPKTRCYEWLQRRILRRFEAVIAVSAPLRHQLARSGIPGQCLHLIPNARPLSTRLASRAEARARLGLPAEGAVIGWVGRLGREKAPDVALQALHRLGPGDWTAAFLGDGPEQPPLQALANRLDIASRVRWLGPVPKAGDLLGAFDLLLQSSRTEGTPAVLLEAMAAGVPIVATAVGGVPDLLADGAGWLVPADDPLALSRALEQALTDPAARAFRATKARQRLTTEYDPVRWLDRHEAVYRSLLERVRR